MNTEKKERGARYKIRKFVPSFLLQIWVILVVCVVLVSEFLWLPSNLESTLNQHINRFQFVLQVSSRLFAAQSSDLERDLLLTLLNKNAESQHWLEIVYAEEASLRLQAAANTELQLLLQPLSDSSLAYGLWFNPTEILREKEALYRCFELILIAFVTFIIAIIWVRRCSFIASLKKLIESAKSLADGDFNTPFPKVNRHSGLIGLYNAFEVSRKALSKSRSELLDQVDTNKLSEQRLHDSQEVAKLGSWEWIVQEDTIWFSTSLEKILSIKKSSEHLGINEFFQQVHPADRKALLQGLGAKLQVGTIVSTDFRVSVEGDIKHVHLMANVKQQADGKLRLIGTCQDISERKDIESLLKKLSSAITASSSGVMITDLIGIVEYLNPKFTETTGYELEDLAGSASVILSRDCLPEGHYDEIWGDILSGKSWRGDLQNIRKDGSLFWSVVSISPINNEYNELTHFVIVCEDVSELKDAHAKMEQLALFDELTGLPNRRLLFRKLTELFRHDVMKSPAVVMLLDLDNFKAINDTQGHPAGDKLLIEVANRLKLSLPDEGFAARLGGDEFAILISPVKNVEQIENLAKQVLDDIARPFIINGNEIKISTSIGLAWLPKDGNMPDTILKHADLAMYQAKEMGRNQYRQFTEQLHDQLQRYIRFSRELPEALANGDFYLCFQPKVDLTAKKIIGVETLIRWKHPELGNIPPFDFISIAEDSGFIVPLGNWVFAEACRQMKKLREMGYADLTCAINISLRQFSDPSLLGVIEKSVRDNGLNPQNLEVEITESLLMEDVDKAIMTLKKIQKLGISVAIDDFGTGYSSFSYLKNLPINVLKVDRCFIKDIPESQEDMKITSAIISMAHSLNLKVVAEGIETESQSEILLEQKCDIGQGYLFGKPMRLAELKQQLDQEEFLRQLDQG